MKVAWNRLKAGWYNRSLKYSDFAKKALSLILPMTEKERTFLDLGAGCGALAIPLARAGKKVTAVDSSPALIDILEKEALKEGLKNIKALRAAPYGAALRAHDVVLCSAPPVKPGGPEEFIEEAQRLARKKVFLIEDAGGGASPLYFDELYPLLFGKEFRAEDEDYLVTYSALHGMGVFANVRILDYSTAQPFDDLDEAVEFWKEYLGIVTEEHDRKLKSFLEGRLVRKKGVLLAEFRKKSAVIWWEKGKTERSKG